MKVLWLHNFNQELPGAGHFVFNLPPVLSDLGVQVVSNHVGRFSSPLDFCSAIWNLRKCVAEYDIVHAQFGSKCGFVTSYLPGVKLLTLRGSDWYRLPASAGFAHSTRSVVRHGLTRARLRKFAGIVVVSNRMAREIAPVRDARRVWVVPSPIDLAKFSPMEKDAARRLLGREGISEPWILFTTHLAQNPVKRTGLANAVIQELRRRGIHASLVTAQGVEHAKMPLFVNSADVILHTAYYEGWPNAIKEALSCGVPFVSTDVSDLSEIASQEDNCVVCEPNVSQLASGVIRALKVGRSIKLRRHVEPMALHATARKIKAIYQHVLSNGSTQE